MEKENRKDESTCLCVCRECDCNAGLKIVQQKDHDPEQKGSADLYSKELQYYYFYLPHNLAG